MDASPQPPTPTPRPVPVVVDESALSLARLEEPATWQAGTAARFTTLAGHGASLVGGRLGLVKREMHVVSVAAYQSVSGEPAGGRGGRFADLRSLDFRYAGLLLGWEADGLTLFQSYGHVLVGAARAEIGVRPPKGGGNAGAGTSERARRTGFVLEPEIGLTWKVTRPVRATVGVAWRGVWGSDVGPLRRKDLDGFAAAVGVIVGTYPDLVVTTPAGGTP